jgi:hypothetical protein
MTFQALPHSQHIMDAATSRFLPTRVSHVVAPACDAAQTIRLQTAARGGNAYLLPASTLFSRTDLLPVGQGRRQFVTQNSISVSQNLALGFPESGIPWTRYNHGELQQENP